MNSRTNINELFETICEVIDLIDRAKCLLNKTVESLFTYLPVDTVLPLKEPCDINTWNRGYGFTVTGFKKRGDDSIMMCGTYCGKDDTEFLSYIYGFDSIEKLSVAVKASFFQSISF